MSIREYIPYYKRNLKVAFPVMLTQTGAALVGIADSIMVGHYSTTDLAAVKVLIWAPKSLFKSAVSRNRLRRQMREAYRLNSLPLKDYCGRKGITMQVAFNYIAREQLPFAVIQKAMVKAVNKLIEA